MVRGQETKGISKKKKKTGEEKRGRAGKGKEGGVTGVSLNECFPKKRERRDAFGWYLALAGWGPWFNKARRKKREAITTRKGKKI